MFPELENWKKKFSLHLRTHPGKESSKANMFTIRGWNVYLKELLKDSHQQRSSVVLWKCEATTWDRHPVGSKSPEHPWVKGFWALGLMFWTAEADFDVSGSCRSHQSLASVSGRVKGGFGVHPGGIKVRGQLRYSWVTDKKKVTMRALMPRRAENIR